jgi:hypothetical protein
MLLRQLPPHQNILRNYRIVPDYKGGFISHGEMLLGTLEDELESGPADPKLFKHIALSLLQAL